MHSRLILILGVLLVSGVFFVPARVVAVETIVDGDLIKTAVHDNVYIVKIIGAKKFKRLILNPDIFNQYSHLKWEHIKTVSESTFGQYMLSYLIREIDDYRVYQLFPDEDTGTKRWVNISAAEFNAAGFDWDSIYITNQYERDSYVTGPDLTTATLPQREFSYGIIPGISSTKDIDTLVRLGVDIVRLAPSDLSFAKRDLQSRGIDIMVQKVDSQQGSNVVPPPTDPDRWAQELANVVYANPDIRYWQIWNEPNEIQFWYPQPNAAQYAALLKKAYVAIKGANPNAVVIMGGLSGINPPRQYLRDLYAAGARQYFDVLALHPYHQPSSPDTYLRDYLLFMRNISQTYGDLGKPIWITEIGWPTNPTQPGAITEDQQADYLRRTYDIAQSLDFVKKVFWYRLQDVGSDGMGILGKPAEAVYQAITP